jgi:ferredoxin
MDTETEKIVRNRVAELLNEDVEAFVVFVRKETEPRERITVIKGPEEAEKVALSPLSVNNTARVLLEVVNNFDGKVGVVAKGCDSKAIKGLISEGKIEREKIHIIGISCPGIVDYRKLIAFSPEDVIFEDGKLIIKPGDKEIPLEEVIHDNCRYCRSPSPVIYDEIYGKAREPFDGTDDDEIEKLPADERWKYWIDVFEKCIRCYACRSACPMCYCTECLVDPVNLAISPMSTAEEKAAYPRFLGKTVTPADNLFYHLIRVFHHAGRCADCGECERACPMDIPLRKLERKLQKEIKEIFGYEDEDIPFLAKLDIIPEGR